jgi:hypothetical protein
VTLQYTADTGAVVTFGKICTRSHQGHILVCVWEEVFVPGLIRGTYLCVWEEVFVPGFIRGTYLCVSGRKYLYQVSSGAHTCVSGRRYLYQVSSGAHTCVCLGGICTRYDQGHILVCVWEEVFAHLLLLSCC